MAETFFAVKIVFCNTQLAFSARHMFLAPWVFSFAQEVDSVSVCGQCVSIVGI